MRVPGTVLLAEDTESDVILIRRAFTLAHVTNPIFVVRDGEQAIAYLAGLGQFHDRSRYPMPELLLLDLYMPKADGMDVLRWVRTQPNLTGLKIVMLTASNRIADVNRAYSLGANSFFVKPLDFENVVELTKTLQSYWLNEGGQSQKLAA